ncbi:MAG: AAA family ATPase [Betaproteobacteria bacterium]
MSDAAAETGNGRWEELAIEAGRVFSPSAPIDKRSLFAGRDAQIRALIDAINQKGQHAIVYGERGVGKTSLANVLASFLGKQAGPIIAPRVNCDALDTYSKVWRKAFDRIELQRPATKIRLNAPLQQETFKATELVGDGDFGPDDVRRVLAFLGKTTMPIVIIDEFDRLTPERRRPFADTIKTLSDYAINATVVLVGVAENVDELIGEHESVERALVQVRMPRMSTEEIERIVDTGLKKLEMRIRPEALARITLLSQGLPHYTHLIALHAARAALEERTLEITDEILDRAIEKAIVGAQQSISTAWHQAVGSARKDSLFGDVLLACALAERDQQNTFAPQDVRGPIREITGRAYNVESFAPRLNAFCEPARGSILQRTGRARRYRYRFSNPLMQPFVIMQGFRSGKIKPSLLPRGRVAP